MTDPVYCILKKEFSALESDLSSLQLLFWSEFCSKSEQNSAATASTTPTTNQSNYGTTKKNFCLFLFLQTYFIVYETKEFSALKSEFSSLQLLFSSEFCSKSEQNSAATASTTPATNQSNYGTKKNFCLSLFFANLHSILKKGFLEVKSKIEFYNKKYKCSPQFRIVKLEF